MENPTQLNPGGAQNQKREAPKQTASKVEANDVAKRQAQFRREQMPKAEQIAIPPRTLAKNTGGL
jgi:hypothetical protein